MAEGGATPSFWNRVANSATNAVGYDRGTGDIHPLGTAAGIAGLINPFAGLAMRGIQWGAGRFGYDPVIHTGGGGTKTTNDGLAGPGGGDSGGGAGWEGRDSGAGTGQGPQNRVTVNAPPPSQFGNNPSLPQGYSFDPFGHGADASYYGEQGADQLRDLGRGLQDFYDNWEPPPWLAAQLAATDQGDAGATGPLAGLPAVSGPAAPVQSSGASAAAPPVASGPAAAPGATTTPAGQGGNGFQINPEALNMLINDPAGYASQGGPKFYMASGGAVSAPPVPGWGGAMPWDAATAPPQGGPGGPGMPPMPGQSPAPGAAPPPMGPSAPGGPPGAPQAASGPLQGLPPMGQQAATAPVAPLGQPQAPGMAEGGAAKASRQPADDGLLARLLRNTGQTFQDAIQDWEVAQRAGTDAYGKPLSNLERMARTLGVDISMLAGPAHNYVHYGDPKGPPRPEAREVYAKGGLVEAAEQIRGAGRWEDSRVVHLNPEEMRELAARHGAPTINPETGLPEFGLGHFLGKLLKTVAPIAALAIPGIGEALGPALEGIVGTGTVLGTSVAADLGSALAGAALGGVTGGGKGALIGGLTSGAGSVFGPSISGGLEGMGVSSRTAGALVNAGLGAGASAAAGRSPLTGALMSGALSYLAPETTRSIQDVARPSGANDPLMSGMAAIGQGAQQPAGSTEGLAANTLPDGTLLSDGAIAGPAPSGGGAAAAGSSGSSLLSQALPALMLLSLAGGSKTPKVFTTPPPADNAPPSFRQQFSPTAYAPQVNPEALRRLLENPGAYASQGGPSFYQPGTTGFQFGVPGMAHGGALHQVAAHMSAGSPAARAGRIKGAGDGQSDDVDAKLATGEHVFDSATVSLAGRGDNDAGHRRLEKLKEDIRREARIKNPKKPPMMKEGALSAAFKRAS